MAIIDLKSKIYSSISSALDCSLEELKSISLTINTGKSSEFGDFSCNAAMVFSKSIGTSPISLAQKISKQLSEDISEIESVQIAGPGFINITLSANSWQQIASSILNDPEGKKISLACSDKKKYLVEFVSPNPTGPLHLAHGRNAIIGDVLARVLSFLGHDVTRECYINDAGVQITNLGKSLKSRVAAFLGEEIPFPEEGYKGEYLQDVAEQLVTEQGKNVLEQPTTFFSEYAKNKMLALIKVSLDRYGIAFDNWFSELSLHVAGEVDLAVKLLEENGLAYKQDDALWFKSTEFGDDKDRVLKKTDGSYTYIAPDLAYHKNKFDRGFDKIIDIFGQDHHGYVHRLKGVIKAIGYDAEKLDVILYQLVRMKKGEAYVRMSKRSGNFELLSDVIDAVGVDVARFFYLNRKADSHLEFDLDIALKKTDENPVYYIQYALVRMKSILEKASKIDVFSSGVKDGKDLLNSETAELKAPEISILKKICLFGEVLNTIESGYQTHLLTTYSYELAQQFHAYYNSSRVIDQENIETSCMRLAIIEAIKNTLELTLDLLGLSKPEKM
jgi:arginyl-tRNA synthetase